MKRLQELGVLGVLLGVLIRTGLPYLRRQDKGEGWSHKFTLTAILSIIGGIVVTTQTIVGSLPVGADLLTGLLVGIGSNTAINETVKTPPNS